MKTLDQMFAIYEKDLVRRKAKQSNQSNKSIPRT